jgi:hypothetical protein
VTIDPDYVFDVTRSNYNPASVREALEDRGFAVLRNLFAPETIAAANRGISRVAASPAIAGTIGYAKVDYPKRMFSPFVVGGPLVGIVLDERVIDIVEAVMDSPCILAESNVKIDEGVNYTYFPLHADFSAGWSKNRASDFRLSAEALELPIGIGGAIYLHDTTEGAFCYCEGTHRLRAPRGQALSAYPAEEQRAIRAKKVRIDGLAGDFVLFDDRGFHGPDHPSRVQRTVILVDYFRVATFGYAQVSPFPVWTSDLGGLSAKQMRVLGVGAASMVQPAEYMLTRFRKSWAFPVARRLIDNAYLWQHFKQQVKAAIGRSSHR